MTHSHTTSEAARIPIITDAERLLRLIVETSDEPGAIEITPGRTLLDGSGEPTDKIELLCWRRDMTDAQRRATPGFPWRAPRSGDLGRRRHDLEQRYGRSGRATAVLLPVLQGTNADVDQSGKLALTEPDPFAHVLRRRPRP